MIWLDQNTKEIEERKRQNNNLKQAKDAYDYYKKFSKQGSASAGGYGSVPSYAAGTPEEFAAYDAAAADASQASWLDGLFGGGSSGGVSAGGSGAGGAGGASGGSSAGVGAGAATAGYVIAAILGQMAATHNTDTEFEGQKTGNFFSFSDDPSEMNPDDMSGNWRPRVFTEPWLAWAHSELGWEQTAGEKMDAAVQNEDWDTALKRLPAAADYWADPIRSWLGHSTWKNIAGDEIAWLIDPIGGLLDSIEGWF